MSVKLTPAMRLCLEYYRDNEHNQHRVSSSDCGWTRRQLNRALDLDFLLVGPGGWHILSPAGREALSKGEKGS